MLDKQTLIYILDLIEESRSQAVELEYSHTSYEEKAFFKGVQFAHDQTYNALSRMIYGLDELE